MDRSVRGRCEADLELTGQRIAAERGFGAMQASESESNGIGQPVRRKEDFRLLTGRGRFVDDLTPPGLAHAVFVR
jgi:hypothetical protein